jgi:carboxypeptidase C (cathepsin A)
MSPLPLLLLATLLATPPQDRLHQTVSHAPAASSSGTGTTASGAEKEPITEEKPVTTHHEITLNGKALKYRVTAGMLPINSATGETEAQMFFVAYTADTGEKTSDRPLLFAFNGGPGSSSVWLHLGTVGPRRVKLADDGSMPAAPFRLTDNTESWLDVADLVFIDPVGTGYSRAVKADQATKFFSLKGDLDSIGEFIRLYLTRYERWSSPLFLAGESYGSTRAAGLAGNLVDQGIAFNGIILVSTVLNFGTIIFSPANDLAPYLFLPSYTATAWYHKKLGTAPEKTLTATLSEVTQWAESEYLQALWKGDRLTPRERQAIIKKLAAYTGLDERYIDNNNLRLEATHFTKELLRDRKRIVGRFDSRLLGTALHAAGEDPEFDPSLTAIRPPFTAAFLTYIRNELGFRTDREYYILGGGVGRWDWGTSNSYTDTGESLRGAMTKNPAMKVLVASGYFDLATPFFATEYTFSHLHLEQALRQNITATFYEGGHMMYTDTSCRRKLKEDVASFIRRALAAPDGGISTGR